MTGRTAARYVHVVLDEQKVSPARFSSSDALDDRLEEQRGLTPAAGSSSRTIFGSTIMVRASSSSFL